MLGGHACVRVGEAGTEGPSAKRVAAEGGTVTGHAGAGGFRPSVARVVQFLASTVARAHDSALQRGPGSPHRRLIALVALAHTSTPLRLPTSHLLTMAASRPTEELPSELNTSSSLAFLEVGSVVDFRETPPEPLRSAQRDAA